MHRPSPLLSLPGLSKELAALVTVAMVLARMTLQSLPGLTPAGQPRLGVSSCVPQPWAHFLSSVRSPSGSPGTASGVQLLNKCWF